MKPFQRVRIQTEDVDVLAEKQQLQALSPAVGAVVEFTGCVRADVDAGGAQVEAIYLEHYPGMAEKAIDAILDEAAARWPLIGITVIHRVGLLPVGANIVYVGVASAHRQAAMDCTVFIMDFLKNDVPLWKKVISSSRQEWIGRKASDEAAKKAWLGDDDS